MNYKIQPLKDLVKITSGFAFKSNLFNGVGEGLPLIRIRDVVRGYSDTFYSAEYKDDYVIKNGDALIGMDGEFNLAQWKGGKALLNQRVCKIESISEELNQEYLIRFLPKALKDIEDKTPFVTVKHLSVKDINNIQIPLPSLSEQKRIAQILDKADEIRQKRQQSIEKLDELLQATFIDMFGDPVTNPKGWKTKTIEEMIADEKYSLKRGPFGGALKKEIFVESGYLVYEQYHALNNDFSFQRYFIDEDKYQELKSFEVKPKDIIISCSGVNLGKLAEVPTGSPKGIINQALLKITLNNNIMQNQLFIDIFQSPNFKSAFYGDFRGAAIPNFPPMTTFKSFKFIVPPIQIQKDYIQIKEKINNLKAMHQKILDKKLFESLQQRAFNGEL